jgi:hypothetical protein
MEKLAKTIYIDAALTTIFDYLRQPSNLMSIWPGALALIDMEPLAHGGHTFRWMRKFCNVRFEGLGDYIPDIEKQKIAFKTSGGLVSQTTISLTLEEKGTRATLMMEYTLPEPLRQKHSSQAIKQQCEHDAELLLLNLSAEILTQEARQAEQTPDEMRDPQMFLPADIR